MSGMAFCGRLCAESLPWRCARQKNILNGKTTVFLPLYSVVVVLFLVLPNPCDEADCTLLRSEHGHWEAAKRRSWCPAPGSASAGATRKAACAVAELPVLAAYVCPTSQSRSESTAREGAYWWRTGTDAIPRRWRLRIRLSLPAQPRSTPALDPLAELQTGCLRTAQR